MHASTRCDRVSIAMQHDTAAPTAPEHLTPNGTALFLDFDGTLAPIVADPAKVEVPKETLVVLGRLYAASGGAVAVVSGRPIAQLDRLLAPLRLPLAGVHGRERRSAERAVTTAPASGPELEAAVATLENFARDHPGTLVEEKPGSVALHYRQRAELESEALTLARDVAAASPTLRLLEGKMVAELCVGSLTKGDAISAFMAEAPFLGRRPVFIGDDVTDEEAFPVVNMLGGESIKVGPGATQAKGRFPDIGALEHWLARLARGWLRD